MAEEQRALIGTHVDELTIFIGRVRDTGRREMFVALSCEGKRHLSKKTVADWVATDHLVSLVSSVVYLVESGATRPHTLGVALEFALESAEADPF